MPEGLLLAEASHWDLQTYIDEIYRLVLRKKWCHQEQNLSLISIGTA
jgi:hypothetical protein